MSKPSSYHEILLLIDTNFSGKELLEKEGKNSFLSKTEQLKQACWKGLVPEVLPEIFNNTSNESAVLWKIDEAFSFIDLGYGDFVRSDDKSRSVNPYIFAAVQNYN